AFAQRQRARPVVPTDLRKSKRPHAEQGHSSATSMTASRGRSGDESILPCTADDRRRTDCGGSHWRIVMKNLGKHAIVIGASMSGLLAARALSDFYTTVTVLERDAFPAADTPRKGVPQGHHTHGLLARGSQVLEEFFPGYNNEVVAQSGGLLGDIANDVTWIGHDVTLASGKSDMIGLAASRPVLEGHLRRRLLALPNVRAIENCAVQGLASDPARKSVTGVRARVDGKPEEIVNADLVVDATGRGSSSAAWLEK